MISIGGTTRQFFGTNSKEAFKKAPKTWKDKDLGNKGRGSILFL